MGLVEIVLIAIGLAMDAFAVSLGIGTGGRLSGLRSRLRLSSHFGLFQALMPLLGWIAGSNIDWLIREVDHWVAFGLLAFVGVRMLRSGLGDESSGYDGDPSRGRTLVILSVATSIDAFAVGLTLAMLRVNIALPAIVIGLVTGTLSLAGLGLGQRLGQAFGKRMEILGGLILIGIGARILITHLMP